MFVSSPLDYAFGFSFGGTGSRLALGDLRHTRCRLELNGLPHAKIAEFWRGFEGSTGGIPLIGCITLEFFGWSGFCGCSFGRSLGSRFLICGVKNFKAFFSGGLTNA